jgi:hypothetical protein
MNETTRSQAEGLQFLTNYRSAFTTRSDGSSWPKFKRTWHNAACLVAASVCSSYSRSLSDFRETDGELDAVRRYEVQTIADTAM